MERGFHKAPASDADMCHPVCTMTASSRLPHGATKLIDVPEPDPALKIKDTGVKEMPFQVDTRLIPHASLEEQTSRELKELGLDVFNQEEFEQGFMDQVNQAIVKQEEEKVQQSYNKEMKMITDKIKMTIQELSALDQAPSTTVLNRDSLRNLESIQKQKKIKELRLKALFSKQKAVQAKHDSKQHAAATQNKVLDLFSTGGSSNNTDATVTSSIMYHQDPSGNWLKYGSEAGVISQNMETLHSSYSDEIYWEPNDFIDKNLEYTDLNEKSESVMKSRQLSSIGDDVENVQTVFDTHNAEPSTSYQLSNEGYDEAYTSPEEGEIVDDDDDAVDDDVDTAVDDDDPDDDYHPDADEYMSDDMIVAGAWSSNEGDDKGISKHKLHRKNKSHAALKEFEPYENINEVKKLAKSRADPPVRMRDDGDIEAYRKRIKKFEKEEEAERYDRLLASLPREEGCVVDGKFKVPARIWNKLYKYQKTCVKWLWELHTQQAGGIMGDEMGLGKTIQIIAYFAGLRYSKLQSRGFRYFGLGPCIIVCPTTVMHQWVREFHQWYPPFRVAVLHSTGSFSGDQASLVQNIVSCCGILVTSYSNLVLQQTHIMDHDWHYVVLDEGHKIRNPNAQATLCCKQFKTPHRFILSGSPIQNNLRELWSLFDFVFPGKLGTLPDFMQHFSVPIVQGGYTNASDLQVQTAYRCACILRDTINPYLLRRMKADVRGDLTLPDKNEQVLFCRLTDDQRDAYKEYLTSWECESILAGKFKVFAGLIALRKICNHPDICTGGPRLYVGEEVCDEASMQYGYWRRSGKMIVVEALLRLWRQQGHRVLLFSQSVKMLNILESFIRDVGYTYVRMDGTSSIASRQPLIQKYNSSPEIYVFLLTTRVGGLGVNLTGANRVIIFDPDWNPSTDIQARERAWRIGQSRQVTVYRLLTTGTIEEKIYHRQIFKQFLSNRILKDPRQRRLFKSNDLYELFTLGDKDDKEEPETCAIFSAIGTDVKVQPRKVNRFDALKMKATSAKKTDTKESKNNEDKYAKMRDLAKRLSSQMSSNRNEAPSNEGNDADRNGHYLKRKISGKTKLECSEEKQSKESDYKETSSRSKKKHKRKKKHKAKDAKFEGETIPHLVKHDTFRNSQPNETPAASLDDYVLQKLLKKTGVDSAIQHDAIMDSSAPDHSLVEAEAQRVAKDAVNLLRKSRAKCLSATSGVPTWTGQHGGIKPRFGSKKSNLIKEPVTSTNQSADISSTCQDQANPSNSTKAKVKHFDGGLFESSTSNATEASTSKTLTSSDLLTKMRSRNGTSIEGATSGTETDWVVSELLTDIRNCISFQCATDGQATTRELLDKFASKLPQNSSAQFKALLNQICDFQKTGSGVSIWRLKSEFR